MVIPYGISDDFRSVPEVGSPPPSRAIFTSNPLRSLDWLLDIWETRIHRQVPRAELHIFSGATTYGRVGASKSADMEVVLDRARSLSEQGGAAESVPKQDLVAGVWEGPCMYKGDTRDVLPRGGEVQPLASPL